MHDEYNFNDLISKMSELVRANDFKNCIYCKIIEINKNECKLLNANNQIIDAHIYSDYRNKLRLNNDDIVLVYYDCDSEYYVIYSYTSRDLIGLKNEIPFDITYDFSDDSFDDDPTIKNLYSLDDLKAIISDIKNKKQEPERIDKFKANMKNVKIEEKYKHKARGGKNIIRDKTRARDRDKKTKA